MASQNDGNLLEWTYRGRRAVDRVPDFGTLRPAHHWVNIEYQHELTFTWETLAPAARRFSTQGRSARAFSRRAGKTAQKNILAAIGGIFWKRQRCTETGNGDPQWRPAVTAIA